MKNKIATETVVDEIKLLIAYAVDEENQEKACGLVEKYKANRVALSLLKEFYSSLPEAREEPVIRIAYIAMHKGVFLLGVSTGAHDYVFFATQEAAGSLGEYQEDHGDEEAFGLFGYASKKAFLKQHPDMRTHKDFDPILPANEDFCPVCSAAVGENHHLGCPVEVCPWCLGQLNKCNCRFDQMDIEEMVDEYDIERFEQLLDDKGRIPFAAGQGPSYPVGGKKR